MADVFPPEAMRILRDMRRTLAGYQALFDAQRDATNELSAEVARLRADMTSQMKQGFIQQNAVLAHNSVLLDELEERIDALEGKTSSS